MPLNSRVPWPGIVTVPDIVLPSTVPLNVASIVAPPTGSETVITAVPLLTAAVLGVNALLIARLPEAAHHEAGVVAPERKAFFELSTIARRTNAARALVPVAKAAGVQRDD